MKTYKLIHIHNIQPVTREQLADAGAMYLPLKLNRETPPTRVPDGMAWAEVIPRPIYNPGTERLVPDNSIEKLDWRVEPLTSEEIAARVAQRRNAEADAADNNINPGRVKAYFAAQLPDDDEVLALNADLFPAWRVGVEYQTGTLLQYDGRTIRVVQQHTSQHDWQPLDLPALYTVLGATDPGTGLAEWVQPSGAQDAYPVNAEVSHNGTGWRSLVDSNVWEPSESVPTLWEPI